eukprot:m.27655 g.27655  ORF g.27655 m.27655 type:complete len:256 (+) comp15784_c0_seq1:238-1005(+)
MEYLSLVGDTIKMVVAVSSAGVVAAAIVLAVAHIYLRSSPTAREKLTSGGLGLGNRKKTRSHAVLDVKDFETTTDWLANAKRSIKSTLKEGGQIDRAWAEHGVVKRVVSPRDMGFAHFWVLFQHQRRSYSSVRAFVASALRFFVACSMVGTIDEYRATKHNDVLVGWSQIVIKGKTLRGMWFYQTKFAAAHKMYVWHGAIRDAVALGIATKHVEHVDIGPSRDQDLRDMKARFGFLDCEHWKDICNYSGPFNTER